MPTHVLTERRRAADARVEQWRHILTQRAAAGVDPDPVLLAEDASGLLGFGSALPRRDADEDLPPVELTALYVRARCWGTGLGHRLLVAALGDRAAYLWVLAGNGRAIGFYGRQGFALDGAVDDSDPHGRHLRMVRR
nr:GNAT family N-acetyltransferase [Nocardioides dokdonensis]